MKIHGYTDDQLAALCELWNLGRPINVSAFLERTDIPTPVKDRVRNAANTGSTDAERHRLAQGQILIEVAKLDREKQN
jgi:hypothetical protein